MSDDDAPSALWVTIDFEDEDAITIEAQRMPQLDAQRNGLRVYLAELTKSQARAVATSRAVIEIPFMPAHSTIMFRLRRSR